MKKARNTYLSHRKMERRHELEKWWLVVIARALAFLTVWITHC